MWSHLRDAPKRWLALRWCRGLQAKEESRRALEESRVAKEESERVKAGDVTA